MKFTKTYGKKVYEVIVDEEHAYLLQIYKWGVSDANINNKWRPQPYVWIDTTKFLSKKFPLQKLHRLILNAPIGFQVDHINGNTLDNRTANLRVCTRSQNMANQKSNKKYKGVHYDSRKKKYRAQICVNQKDIKIGYFDREELAGLAYDVFAIQYFGRFAKTNFLNVEDY